ncbi:hypothetical protein PENSPDRAFT_659113 [Peniophora sp. CONT]|nr:hypothetical protein PENSPDRAFT_659113 [Peniophora sp. CONT]
MSISHASDAPWDNASADIILRSSDGPYFKADRLLLIRAFQAFEDMFSCAEIGVSEEQETKDGCIVIELSESSDTVERLLRLIYCMNTRLDDLDSAAMLDLCVALDKYCVKFYPRAVLDRFTALADKEPELVYIHACRLRLYEVARAAATASLRVPRLFGTVSLSELNISARQYHALVAYRTDCLEKAVGIVKDFAWMGKLKPTPPGLHSDRSCDACYKTGPRAWLDPVRLDLALLLCTTCAIRLLNFIT